MTTAAHLAARGVGRVTVAGAGGAATLPIVVTSAEDVAALVGELAVGLVIAIGDADAARAAVRACGAAGVGLLVGGGTTVGPLHLPGQSACPG